MNKKLLIGFFTAAVLCGVTLAEENLLVNSSASDGTKNWAGKIEVVKDAGGQSCFKVVNHNKIVAKQLIPIDPTATYKISLSLKSGTPKPNKVYIGLMQYDKDKRYFDATTVTPFKNSDTILVAPANKGDKTIKIKSAKNWDSLLKQKRLTIACEIDDSGNYSDLPNRKISNIVTKLEEKDGIWIATLKTPLTFSAPVNSKVRAHAKCGHYMYALTFKKHMNEWTVFSGKISPAKKTGSPSRRLWSGVKFAKILLLANWAQKDGETLMFKDVKFEKVTK
jgi:hypothetical protein